MDYIPLKPLTDIFQYKFFNDIFIKDPTWVPMNSAFTNLFGSETKDIITAYGREKSFYENLQDQNEILTEGSKANIINFSMFPVIGLYPMVNHLSINRITGRINEDRLKTGRLVVQIFDSAKQPLLTTLTDDNTLYKIPPANLDRDNVFVGVINTSAPSPRDISDLHIIHAPDHIQQELNYLTD